MSASVKVKLRGHVKAEEILNFLKQKVDAKAISKVGSLSDRKDKSWYMECGYMFFDCGNLYYYYNSKAGENRHFLHPDDYNYWVEKGLKEIAETETTDLSMCSCKENIDLMKQIVAEFGGWIDDNDCDDEFFYQVMKNPDGTIKPIRYVTMQEVYDRFGEVVIVKDC